MEAVKCEGCNGHGMVGNILEQDHCSFCFGTGQAQMAKEQYAKVRVVIERTYLLPVIDGKSIAYETPEEIVREWFTNPAAMNYSNPSRERYRLGGSDVILSAEITNYIDVPDGTI